MFCKHNKKYSSHSRKKKTKNDEINRISKEIVRKCNICLIN